MLLSILKPLADVGVYSVAYRFIEQVLYIPSFFVAAVFPIIASYHATGDALLKLAIDKSFAFLVILGFPVTAALFVLAPTSSTSSRARLRRGGHSATHPRALVDLLLHERPLVPARDLRPRTPAGRLAAVVVVGNVALNSC